MRLNTSLAGIRCTVVQTGPEGAAPELLVVLCHGFGAPGDDLVGLAEELEEPLASAPAIRFVFPHAPDTLEQLGYAEGRAWWMIDVGRFQAAQSSPELARRLHDEVPDGLPRARRGLIAAIEEGLRQAKLGPSRLVLGGFSQGSMLATDVALRLEEAPAGLVVMSGVAINESEWKRRAPNRAGLPVLQSHGRWDQILPFAGGERLHRLFEEAGLNVVWVPFDGPHTIPGDLVGRLASFLRAAAARGR